MAKRRGKAHNRQQRRNAQRSRGQRPVVGSQPATAEPELSPAASSGGSNDAFERADAEVRASAAPPLASIQQRRPKGRAADPRITVTGASRLGERAAAEYHYVVRDLRNIGILLVVLAVLLAAATIAVNVMGIGRV